jgi:ryanodine receptor 2
MLALASYNARTFWIQENHPVEYKPAPIPTAGVSLTPDILELTELLARNAHDTWAQQRLADGWTHGPRRDDAARKHPCLVPYEELPESEKEYDRKTALETLKVILTLGYRIEKR